MVDAACLDCIVAIKCMAIVNVGNWISGLLRGLWGRSSD